MLKQAFLNTFERESLREEDIFAYEEVMHPTAVQNVSTLPSIKIESRNTAPDEFDDIEESYLLVKFKLVQNVDGGVLHANNVASLDHGAWSLFRNVKLSLNQQIVDDCLDPGFTYNLLMKTLLTPEKLQEVSHEEFYYPAGMPRWLGQTASDPVANNTDPTFLIGAARLAGSTSVWAKLPLKRVLKFVEAGKVYNGCNFTISLEKNDDYSEIICRPVSGQNANIVNVKTVIEEVQWIMPRMKVSKKLALDYEKDIASGKPIVVDWLKANYVRLTGGSFNFTGQIFSGMKKPRFILVSPQPSASVDTQESHNKSLGVANTVTEAYIVLNGKQFPSHKYNSDGSNIREVEACRRLYGRHKSDENTLIIRPDNFSTYHAIYVFDISHIDDVFENNNYADAIARLQFNSAVDEQTYHVVVLGENSMKFTNIGGRITASANL